MSNVPAKFASAIVLSAVVGAAAIALPPHLASAADGCQTNPGDEAPQGKHWYYRIERGTGRHCWYMRGEEEKSARADAPAAAPAEKPAARGQDTATSRSIADAHAEIAPRTRAPDDAAAAAPSVWPNPPAPVATATDSAAAAAPTDNNAPASPPAAPLASRWPQASDAAPSGAASPAPEASLMVADAESDTNANADTSSQQPEIPPPPVASAPERNAGSVQKLLLVAFGALALAGLTGSAVYRLGRRRRRDDWLLERTNWQSEENPRHPPWVDEPQLARPNPDVPDLDELAAPQSDFAQDMGQEMANAEDSSDRVEKIEDFLARFTRQLHEELESTTRSQRDAHAPS
jgi:hypothetical protein